jgi:hypothetical protein
MCENSHKRRLKFLLMKIFLLFEGIWGVEKFNGEREVKR